jgi:diguanylate cyclase (GGDEF)-like protein/PAS domain S-box-containing protein
MTSDRSWPSATRDAPAALLLDGWAVALAGPNPSATLRRRLGPLADSLLSVIQGHAGLAIARAVGAALVTVGFDEPGALERTLVMLQRELVDHPRGPELTAALAAGYAGGVRDLARTAAEPATRDAHGSRFGAVFSHTAAGIMIIAIGGKVVEVNPAFCAMFGRGPEAFVGSDVYVFARLDDEPGSVEEVRDLLDGDRDQLSIERTYLHRDGSPVRVQASLSLVRGPGGEPRYVICLVEDVTERFRLQSRLRFHADHDPLTGLATRAVLAERLQLALDEPGGRPVGICAIDLDGFRGVNDTLGHEIGDDLLRAVADRLSGDLGAEGHLVARAGGDEFVVLAVDVDVVALRAIAGRALAAVAQPFDLGGHRVVATATVGIVPGDARGLADAGALLQAADTTLNRAKRHGRGGVAEFEPRLHRRAVSRYALAARMADALAAGEFSLEYQPLVRLADSVTVGVEALVRWNLPSGERIGPDRFVPVAEETGHIVPLGRWVLTHACRQAKAWSAGRGGTGGGMPLLLSVNLAARQIREPGIVTDIADVLAETGWPAASLQVELTESDAMDGSTSLSTLRAIADMGVRIAIDDFGTGYSNLAYLRRLPVQTLKLAAPFVSGPDGDDVDVEIAAALIRLGHSLGMTVVAEAIETAEQCAQLRELGCDVGQGYYFSLPLSAEAVTERMTAALRDHPGG